MRSPESYYAGAVTSEARGIVYCTEEHEKEIARVEQRNEWVRQLRESVKA